MSAGVANGAPGLEDLARRALGGDADALEDLVRALQDDVYRLAMRMLGHPADAEDATQEILLKIVTRLGSFRGESGLRTWAWKVASNHLLSVRRGRREPEGMDLDRLEAMLAAGLAADVPPPPEVDRELLELEVKLGCTQSMLACLDREHRMAFILAEVLDLTSEEGGEILGIEPAAFRKRVSRARQRLRAFMERSCGLASEEAACRCDRQIGPSIAAGLLDRARPVYSLQPASTGPDPRVRDHYLAIERARRITEIHRAHPGYLAPEDLARRVRALIGTEPA